MKKFPVLETERLYLRQIGENFLVDMFEIYSDPKIMFFYGESPHLTTAQTLITIQSLESKFQNGLSIEWGLIHKETKKLVGTIGFNKYQVGLKGDIGFGLNGTFCKCGFASEALRAVLRYGFDELRLHRIEAEVDPRNRSAHKLLTSNGFLNEGLLRENEFFLNEFCSTVVFGKLATDM